MKRSPASVVDRPIAKKRIPSLDGLRAISILLVILSHYRLKYLLFIPYPFNFFFDGQLGVNIFFVISGFLITRLYLEEMSVTGKFSLGKFYRRRIFRILPAFYFLLAIYAILQWAGIIYLSENSWLTSIFFLKYFHMSDPQTNHFWTLSMEEHFYILFPLCLLYCRKYIKAIIICCICLIALFRLICHHYHYLPFDTDLNIFFRGDALLAGCLFAFYEQGISSGIERLSQKISPVFSLIAIMAGLLSLFTLSGWNYKYSLHLGWIIQAIGNTTGTLANLLVGFLILFSINYVTGWSVLLNTSLLIYVGRLSYSLYLWQQILIFSPPSLPLLNLWPVSLLLIFAAANLSYYLIESPFLRIRKQYEVLRPDIL